MADAKRLTLTIVLDEQGKPIKTELDKINNSVKKLEGQTTESSGKMSSGFSATWKSMTGGILAAQVISAAFNEMKQFVGDSVRNFMEAERVNRSLSAALETTGRPVQELSAHFIEFANEMQRATIYGDEEIKNSQALLLQLTNLDRDGIDKATQGAIGLASVMGMDLQSATNLVAKATAGNASILSRYGIQIDTTKSKEDQRAQVLEKLGGFYKRATAETETYSGQLAQLKNKYGDIQESVGAYIVQNTSLLYMRLKVLNKVANETLFFLDTKDREAKQLQVQHDIYSKYLENLYKATDAIGMQRDETNKLIESYGGSIDAVMRAVNRNKDLLKIKQAMSEVGKNELIQFKKNEEERKKAERGTNTLTDTKIKHVESIKKEISAYEQLCKALPPATSGLEVRKKTELQLMECVPIVTEATFDEALAYGQLKLQLQAIGIYLPDIRLKQEQIEKATKGTTEGIKENSDSTKKWTIDWRNANEVMQFAQSLTSGLTDLLGALNVELGESGNAAIQAASGIGQLWAGIQSGNPLSIIQGVTQAISGLIKLFKGDGVGEAIERENSWMQLTKQQVQQLRELEAQYDDTHAATSELLDQFIANANITTDNFDQWAHRLHEIVIDFDRGTLSLQQTQQQMGDAFTALIAKAQALGTEGSAEIISMFEELKGRGLEVAEIQEYINSKLESGCDAYASLKDAIENSTTVQKMFGDISVPIFDDMIKYRKKLADNKDLVDSIKLATTVMTDLSAAGRISQEQFDQFSVSAYKSFKELKKGGMDGSEALRTMGPYLQRLQMLHEQYGFTVDKNTQKLLDQAKKEGIVIENKKSEQREIIDLLEVIAKQLGANIPGALDKTAKAAHDAFRDAREEAKKFGGALELLETPRNIAINTQRRGDYVAAAEGFQGWVAGGSYTKFVTGEREPEFVSVIPQSKFNTASGAWPSARAGSDNRQTVIVEDHSVLNIQIDPKSGIDQNELARTLKTIIADNRQTVVDSMASAVKRKL